MIEDAFDMIEIEGLCKSYDTVEAVCDLDLQVARGQTLGLIGPNGSGKTTLLRMIATLAKPDCGSVTVDGVDAVHTPRDVRRMLAFMPAEFGFPQDMSIGEYMDYFAALWGVHHRERPARLAEIMELTDLAGREDVVVRGLSTGNKQRLLLAKTLISDPALLLLDEPASGLDPRARTEVRAILKELHTMEKTIVISSDILADIQDLCSHVCILEAGEKVLAGAVDELRNGVSRAERVVRLRLGGDCLDAAAERLLQLPGVVSCEVVDCWLHVASAETNCNYILRDLIEAGLEILELHEDRLDLEDVFIQSTRGRVT